MASELKHRTQDYELRIYCKRGFETVGFAHSSSVAELTELAARFNPDEYEWESEPLFLQLWHIVGSERINVSVSRAQWNIDLMAKCRRAYRERLEARAEAIR